MQRTCAKERHVFNGFVEYGCSSLISGWVRRIFFLPSKLGRHQFELPSDGSLGDG
jgi:hypothetical protein